MDSRNSGTTRNKKPGAVAGCGRVLDASATMVRAAYKSNGASGGGQCSGGGGALPRPALAAARSRVSPLSVSPEIFPDFSGLWLRPFNRSATAAAIATRSDTVKALPSPALAAARSRVFPESSKEVEIFPPLFAGPLPCRPFNLSATAAPRRAAQLPGHSVARCAAMARAYYSPAGQ